jgi:hypothetical protein
MFWQNSRPGRVSRDDEDQDGIGGLCRFYLDLKPVEEAAIVAR